MVVLTLETILESKESFCRDIEKKNVMEIFEKVINIPMISLPPIILVAFCNTYVVQIVSKFIFFFYSCLLNVIKIPNLPPGIILLLCTVNATI